MLRTLRDAKISWDEVGWALAIESAKSRERVLGFRFAGDENMNVHVHKNRETSRLSGQRRDVPESHTSNILES